MHKLISLNNSFFYKFAFILLNLALFFIPLKLSITYIFFVPLLISGTIYTISEGQLKIQYQEHQDIFKSFIAFIFILALSSLFGVSFLNSFLEVLQLFLYFLIIPVFSLLFKKVSDYKFLVFLMAGFIISGIHSVFEFINPQKFQQVFVGTVSESGQLIFIIFISLSLLFHFRKTNQQYRLQLLNFICLLTSLLALFCNLKRGPWMGVLIGLVIFFTSFNPLYLIILVPLFVLPFFIWETLQTRLFDSIEHFFIQGGRADLWELASNLVLNFPLGIGFNNSEILRNYSQIIPPEHKHFHNNYLNILIEAGWLSLFLFILFFFFLLKSAFQKSSNNVIALGLFSAISAFLIAGLVEYNFGDSEVLMMLFVSCGLLLSIERTDSLS